MDMPRHNDAPRSRLTLGLKGGIALVISLVALGIMSQAHYIVSRVPSVAAVISSVLVELANADRSAQGLATLTVSPTLTEVARAKAEHMAAHQYFAHTAPDGTTPWHWFKEKNYQFLYAGENLAIDFSESTDVNRAWMQSPTHRANIVGTQFSEIGIATVDGMYQGRPTTYVVQVFGTPAPQPKAPVRAPEPKKKEPEEPVRTEPQVRTLNESATPSAPAVATTLPTTTPVSATEVLGESAGAYLTTQPAAPWWFRILRLFVP